MLFSTLKNRLKRSTITVIISLKHKANANPKLKEKLLVFFRPFPGLKAKFKSVDANTDNAYMKMFRFSSPDQLTAEAREIYKTLHNAIEAKKAER